MGWGLELGVVRVVAYNTSHYKLNALAYVILPSISIEVLEVYNMPPCVVEEYLSSKESDLKGSTPVHVYVHVRAGVLERCVREVC